MKIQTKTALICIALMLTASLKAQACSFEFFFFEPVYWEASSTSEYFYGDPYYDTVESEVEQDPYFGMDEETDQLLNVWYGGLLNEDPYYDAFEGEIEQDPFYGMDEETDEFLEVWYGGVTEPTSSFGSEDWSQELIADGWGSFDAEYNTSFSTFGAPAGW